MGNFAENLNLGNRFRPPCALSQLKGHWKEGYIFNQAITKNMFTKLERCYQVKIYLETHERNKYHWQKVFFVNKLNAVRVKPYEMQNGSSSTPFNFLVTFI